jgi:hypothetical protein
MAMDMAKDSPLEWRTVVRWVALGAIVVCGLLVYCQLDVRRNALEVWVIAPIERAQSGILIAGGGVLAVGIIAFIVAQILRR